MTINAAPRKDPNIEPNPPIIIINKTGNEIAIISNDSVTSKAPKYTDKIKGTSYAYIKRTNCKSR